MSLEYHTKKLRKSWAISMRGRRIKFGFWTNITTDKVVKTRSTDTEWVSGYPKYQYRPLEDQKSIRILELAPGGPDEPLKARIIHNSPTQSTKETEIAGWSLKYDALSYVWGGWDPGFHLIVDERFALTILPNLDVALRRLRSPTLARMLWVDALCINQDDVVERSRQVNMMLDVYARAETVQIWLGPASSESAMGMEIMKYLAEKTLKDPAPWDCRPEVEFVAGFNELLQRTWFQRMWVVQEACVSQEAIMMCGDDSFHWNNDPSQVLKFIRRIKYAAISPQWEQAGLEGVNMDTFLQLLDLQMQHIERQRGETLRPAPDILDVAYSIRHRQASDRRDKLFAIMGLVDQSDKTFFRPDYTMSVEDVFKSFLDSIEI